MGTYKAAIVTERGQNVIAQALAENKPVMFTSAKTSSYAYPLGTNIVALTGLSDVVQSVIPSNSQVINKNVAQVSARFDNDGITQQYQIQTIGLYAQIEGGEEILFSVTQAITPDEMPVQSSVSPSAFIYNIQLAIQNAAQISVTVNPAGTATVADILAITNPEFDDSGIVDTIKSFPDFLKTFKSKMNIFQFLRNLKAGLQFVLHTGQIVNNCTSEAGNLPLSAKQGKVLMDLYTQLYSDKLQSYVVPITSRDTFKEIITSYIPFCVLFFTFESKVSDNPFTLGNGYGICLHSGFRQTWDEVTLIGWSNSSTVPQISTLVL